MIAIDILYALLGISIIIFIHEAGHFLAAKRVGVRVERFAIGFDPPIRGRNLRFFSFRKGDTEYVLGMIPFGGYVKLAGGEMMLETGRAFAPDELPGKSVGARALVFVAGSVMNVASSLVFFMLAFALGVPFTEPRVGIVVPGSPAWEAGIRSGDHVRRLDGTEVTDFGEIVLAVALSKSSEPLTLTVERQAEGGTETHEVAVVPRWDAGNGWNEIGIRPPESRVLVEPPPGSAAERAGLRAGDVVQQIELGGQRLPPLPTDSLFMALDAHLLARPLDPFVLEVERDGKPQRIEVAPRRKEGERMGPQLGIIPGLGNVIRAVQPGSPAATALRPRERLIAVDGTPVATVYLLEILDRWRGKDGRLELTLRDPEGAERQVAVPRDEFLAWNLNGLIHWGEHAARVDEIEAAAPLAQQGLRAGDAILAIAAQPVYSPADIPALLRKAPQDAAPVVVSREGKSVALTCRPDDLAAARGIVWNQQVPLAAVTAGGPADRAGIEPGSTILRLDARPVRSWDDVVSGIRSRRAGETLKVAWRTPRGEEKESAAVLGLDPIEPPGVAPRPLEHVVRATGLDSLRVGVHRTLVSAKQILLTLRSLVRSDVSPKNLSGPIGIAHILTKVAERRDLGRLIYWLALISINLGLFNLLPFPILDGGHLLFLGLEKIKGSPVPVKVQEWAMNVAFFLIICLFLFVTVNDLKRLIG